jgi:hypothetical protein
MLADALTPALAVVGAVGGIVGTAVAVFTYLRDRPRLALTASYLSRLGDRSGLDAGVVLVRLANHGRQPISIVDVGLAPRQRSRWNNFSWSRVQTMMTLRTSAGDVEVVTKAPGGRPPFVGVRRSDEGPILLAPAEVKELTIDVSEAISSRCVSNDFPVIRVLADEHAFEEHGVKEIVVKSEASWNLGARVPAMNPPVAAYAQDSQGRTAWDLNGLLIRVSPRRST